MPMGSSEDPLSWERSNPWGVRVYLTQEYYSDHNVSIVEVPKFDWLVIGGIKDIIQIQYQRNNLKLLTILMVEKK
jgi:hypothetical protein